jgi:hypothetical protein
MSNLRNGLKESKRELTPVKSRSKMIEIGLDSLGKITKTSIQVDFNN